MEEKNLREKMLDKFTTKDGGFILDDSLPNPIFADPGASEEEKERIKKINDDNWNKYIGNGN